MYRYTLFLMTFFLIGCGAKEQLYRLPSPTAHAVEKNSQQRFALRHFETPDYLTQEKLFRQQGVKMVQSALGRWQSEPRQHFKQQWFAELQALLPSDFVEQYPLRDERKPDFIIDIRLERLLADEKNLYLTAYYTINPQEPSHKVERAYALADASDEALVFAHQSALHDLAHEVVARLTR
ncbi:MAG: ABC-type transport auxiliary lipoprotein family protein [Cardiobacteriaceae bacterium]|nr:ABC-type transport auxiliary lipoprotein family protein [Cardiobacteriaceae bacterium]